MDQILKISFNRPVLSLDPRSINLVSSALMFLIYKGLMRLEANGQVVYDLVVSTLQNLPSITYIFDKYWLKR